jgi:hypothetical protein
MHRFEGKGNTVLLKAIENGELKIKAMGVRMARPQILGLDLPGCSSKHAVNPSMEARRFHP